MDPSPGALGPASPRPLHASRERRGRYADAPAGALLTGRGAGEWPALRSGSCAHLSFDGKRGLRPPAVKATLWAENGGRVVALATLGLRPAPPRSFSDLDGLPPLIGAGLVGLHAQPAGKIHWCGSLTSSLWTAMPSAGSGSSNCVGRSLRRGGPSSAASLLCSSCRTTAARCLNGRQPGGIRSRLFGRLSLRIPKINQCFSCNYFRAPMV